MGLIITSKAREVDPVESAKHGVRFVGHQFVKDGRVYGDKRCRICGDWVHWADVEPAYCFEPSVIRKLSGSGKQQCEDWHQMEKMYKKRDEVDERAMKLMGILKKRGLIA